MFWFRSKYSLEQLQADESLTKAYLFDFPGGASCSYSNPVDEGPLIQCTPGDDLKIYLADLPDI